MQMYNHGYSNSHMSKHAQTQNRDIPPWVNEHEICECHLIA